MKEVEKMSLEELREEVSAYRALFICPPKLTMDECIAKAQAEVATWPDTVKAALAYDFPVDDFNFNSPVKWDRSHDANK